MSLNRDCGSSVCSPALDACAHQIKIKNLNIRRSISERHGDTTLLIQHLRISKNLTPFILLYFKKKIYFLRYFQPSINAGSQGISEPHISKKPKYHRSSPHSVCKSCHFLLKDFHKVRLPYLLMKKRDYIMTVEVCTHG